MKSLITIFGMASICLSSIAFARVVVETGDGRTAYTTSTTFFVQASDINPPLDLSQKIVTPSGDILERIDDPQRGLLTKDPSGLLWTSTLMAERPQTDDYKMLPEYVYPRNASYYCGKIGARPPTLTEYKNLAKLFNSKTGSYDARSAALILEPGYTMPGCGQKNFSNICIGGATYITGLNYADKYGYYSNMFGLYITGLPVEGLGVMDEDGLTNDGGAIKCVISPDMVTRADSLKKYEALQMPEMSSCDPKQFYGKWRTEEIVCSNPADSSAALSHAESILFSIGKVKNHFALVEYAKTPLAKENEFISVEGSRGALGHEIDQWFNSDMFTDGAGGTKYTSHAIKKRSDKKGCDVYKIGVSSYDTRGRGFQNLKPIYLFTVGKNQSDGSVILRSSSDGSVNFCFERIKNKTILQALKLKKVN